ncbi:hypothetical protein SAMN05661093_09176 [Kibdelosporangium aridum]|uniref:Uncharacterized protein n=1 Tax=Kibdelosporangium aridum TaxID=2030 RepID=A0A1Y5Y468_KIBAR|nr:hypothetical protein SAMN05661093_09176 [Kibdelosporangium aridum]
MRFLARCAIAVSFATALSVTATIPVSAASVFACPSATCASVATDVSSAIGGIVGDGAGVAYVSSSDGILSKVDIRSGAKTVLARGLGNLRGVAYDLTGVYVADFAGRVIRVDPISGASQVVASGLGALQGIVRYRDLTYVVGGNQLWEIGTTTRLVSRTIGMGMDVDVSGTTAYVADLSGSVWQVDLTTGVTSQVVSGFYEPTHIGVLNDGTVYFLEAASILHRIDPVAKKETPVGQLAGLHPMDFTLDRSGTALLTDWRDNGRIWQLTVRA